VRVPARVEHRAIAAARAAKVAEPRRAGLLPRLPPRLDGERPTPATLAATSGSDASVRAVCPRGTGGIVRRRGKAAAGAHGRWVREVHCRRALEHGIRYPSTRRQHGQLGRRTKSDGGGGKEGR
jgi:hypothetical protein